MRVVLLCSLRLTFCALAAPLWHAEGVAHNKLLAKLCSNMHKPNAQTVLPLNKVEVVFHTLPVERVRGWGGKFGVKLMEKLGVSTAGEASGCLSRWLRERVFLRRARFVFFATNASDLS